MKKIIFLWYGIISYLAFVGTILYAIGFVGNLEVSKTIDGEPQIPLVAALLINASLLLLFALQHSVMARPAFKQWWTLIIPKELERSSYVLLSSLCLMLVMWQWQPVGGIVWSVDNKIAIDLLHILYLAGWGIGLISTFLVNHFDMYGLRQVWMYFNGKPYTELPSSIPGLFQMVRQLLYLGFFIAFWSTPLMTMAHLLFAVLTTVYILTATRFEERDLVTDFDEKYSDYKKWAPMLLPFAKRRTTK